MFPTPTNDRKEQREEAIFNYRVVLMLDQYRKLEISHVICSKRVRRVGFTQI